MSSVPIGELFEYVIGGGWGNESASENSVPVAVIRGADFPEVMKRRVEGLPRRFEDRGAVAKRTLRPGDLVLEISGGTRERPTGRSVFVTESMLRDADEALIPASFCRLVRPSSADVDPAWLFYFLQNWWNEGGSWSYQNQSTGIANFRFKVFSNEVLVDRPRRSVQEGVGEILGALDDKIATNRHVTDAAVGLGEMLVRRSSPGHSQRAISNLADVVMGSSPKGEHLNEEGMGVHFYQGVRDFGRVFPKPRVSTTSPVRMAPKGATLFAVRAPVGEVNLAVEDVCIGRGVASLYSVERPATLHFCLRAFRSIWDEYKGGGTVFASVNGRDVREMRLPMPNDLDGNIERSLASLLARAVQAEQESARLAATRDDLLPLLMSGKITVKDAEKTVEEVV